MTETTQDYLTRYARAAKAHGVPADVIAEKITEIEQHTADGGADPFADFGDPQCYAERSLPRTANRPMPAVATLAAGLLLVVQAGVRSSGDTDLPIGPVLLAAAAGAASVHALHRRLAERQGSAPMTPAIPLVVFTALLVLGLPWIGVGIVLPVPVALTAGVILMAGSVPLLLRAAPRVRALVGPDGVDRSGLAAGQPAPRTMLLLLFGTVTVTGLAMLWLLARS